MNSFRLSDKTRIRILKALLLAAGGSSVSLALAYQWLDRRHSRAITLSWLQHRVIKRFTELADPEISERIANEFEFESIVRDLEL